MAAGAKPVDDGESDYDKALKAGAQSAESPPVASTPAPTPSRAEAVGRGALQGASLGFGDEIAASVDSLVSKIPGVRNVAQAFQSPDLPALTDPNVTYQQRRDAYRGKNKAAEDAHGGLYTAGELAGGLATTAVPGLGALKGAGAVKTGLQAAAIGGAAALGTSNKSTVGGLAQDTGVGALEGGVGGALLHATGSKVASLLAKKGPELQAIADRQAVKQLARDVPQSLTNPMTEDANLTAAINEPIQVAPKKSLTLAEIAGKPAAEVRPILNAGQEKIDQKIGNLFSKSDAATNGGADLHDIAKGYDAKIAQYDKSPGNKKFISALEGARQDALEKWGPAEQEIEAKKGEIGKQIGAMYDKSHAKSGGVELGDFVKHYDDEIATLSKTPGNQAAINALQGAKEDVIKSWGTRPVLDPDAVVKGGSLEGMKSGQAIALLEKQKAANPKFAADLDGEIDRIKTAATQVGFDPTIKVPAKDVRAYATKLQNEGATNVADPKLAAQARKMLGNTTRDFVNGHVESVLGPTDRKALEGLNGRMSNLYKWPDVVSGKEASPAVRDAVLKEFGTKVPTKALNDFAGTLEDRGTQRIDKLTPGEASQAKEALGATTRDLANAHAAKSLMPDDLAEFNRLGAHKASLKNIDAILARREGRETAHKIGLRDIISHGAGFGLAANELAHAVPKALAGDIGGAASHAGSAIVAAGLPFAAKNAAAGGRAALRGTARAVTGTSALLERIVAAAKAGNPWAIRQIQALRSTEAGLARLAALRSGGGGPGIPAEAAQPGPGDMPTVASTQ